MRVPDPGQDARVGQRALQGAVLAADCGREGFGGGVQRLDPARVVLAKRPLAADHVQRRALVTAGLGEEQAAVPKIEGRVTPLAGDDHPGVPPLEAPRDH